MRKLSGLLAAGLVMFGVSAASAVPVPFTNGTLAVQIATLAPVGIVASGVAEVTYTAGTPTAIQLPANLWATVQTIPVANASPISGLIVSAMNGAANFGTTAGVLGGLMPIDGVTKVCLFNGGPGCNAPLTNLVVPLNVVGAGGSVVAKGIVNITVTGEPWTAGTANAFGLTQMGFVSATAMGGHDVRLVTPILTSTSLSASPTVPGFAILTLNLPIPEPGTLLLLGAGVIGLGLVGRRQK